MIKRPWVIGCCLTFWSIVFLLIAILAPIILSNLLEEKVKDSVKLTTANEIKLWGELPGNSKAIMYQHYHFFNILNPEGVMEGEIPVLEEKSGYIYQEYDKFINHSHSTFEGNDIVDFHFVQHINYIFKIEVNIFFIIFLF